MVRWEFDPVKDAANIAKHGISLNRAGEMPRLDAEIDPRHAEDRSRAFGLIGGLPYLLVFTIRREDDRAISLRRCHLEELLAYVARRN